MNFLDSWKSNTSVNFYVRLTLVDSQSQFLISHAIFNCHAYAEWVDRIISCKSSSFSIHDVAFQDTFPTPPHTPGIKTEHLQQLLWSWYDQS
jgi:hypothetical protein